MSSAATCAFVQFRLPHLCVLEYVYTRGQQYQFGEGQYQYQYLQGARVNTQYQYSRLLEVNTQYQYQYLVCKKVNTNTNPNTLI